MSNFGVTPLAAAVISESLWVSLDFLSFNSNNMVKGSFASPLDSLFVKHSPYQ